MKTVQIEKQKENQVEYDLIRGDFQADEAAEIINYMIMKKINFHEVKCFSSEIRFGKVNQASQERIKELGKAREEVKLLVEEAKRMGKTMRISSTISIDLI